MTKNENNLNKQERRRFKRFEEIISIRLIDFSEKTSFNCKSINLSANGMLINVEKEFNVGNQLKLRFMPPGKFDFFESKANIIRTEKAEDNSFNIGVEFVDIDSKENKMMDYHLSNHFKNQ